jgi:hypothetical protein
VASDFILGDIIIEGNKEQFYNPQQLQSVKTYSRRAGQLNCTINS